MSSRWTLADASKQSPATQAAIMADQQRATAARERIMAQAGKAKPYTEDQLKNTPMAYSQPVATPMAASLRYTLKVSESRMQQEVIRWFKENCYEWQLEEEFLMAIPNAAKRTVRNGGRMLAEGLRPGAPDLFLAVPRADCSGFFVEMKTRDGVLSENQRLMLARLTKIGYATVVCRSADEAKAAIRAYLNLKSPSST